MKVLLFILQKEFRQIFRDKLILVMMFAMPTIQLIIMPLAANFEVKDIKIVLVDHDHSTYSRKLASKIDASGYFKIVNSVLSFKEGLTAIENNAADIVLEIPPDFERNLVREHFQKVIIFVDAINGTRSSLGGGYLSAVIADFSKSLDLNIREGQLVSLSSRPGGIDITYSDWFNPRKQYKYFIVPAILVLLLTLIGGFLTALNIVKEKEIGTIEQINVTPIKKWQFILGKLIPFWIVGMTVFTVGLVVIYVVYGIFPEGSLLLLYLFAAVYMVALLGFGLLISTFSSTQVQAMFVAFFFVMIFILMSGFFTSLDSMPAWARVMSTLTPVTHFISVVRLIVLKGSSFSNVSSEFFIELAFAIGLNALAIFNYRKTT